ncbi:complement receptor type 2-like isoform X2 [Larus michahellis]|uniref:complement receptor type 2-like isoform X2 n=1 Tax=Larus michahellis TaxID=119627 RepID=UPI003D9AE6FF
MRSGEAGQGKHPGTLSWGAPPVAQGSGHRALLLALLGLLGMPVARGEYGDAGCVGKTSETCLGPTLLLRRWGGWCHHPPKPGDPVLDALRDAVMDAAPPGAFAWRGSLGEPSRAPGMLTGAGEGARARGPHPRRSPAAGDCGPPPRMTHSRPSSDSSFPVGSRVTYTCIEGAVKIPGRSDTVECLPGERWSKLPEPCGRSCAAPTRLRFAALTKEDERINFFPVGTNVSYVCRPGYENTSESSPTSTCLENLTWSEAAELCRRRSCGEPGALPGGRTLVLTDLQFGARVMVFCEDGYKLNGRHFIYCQLKGNDVEWSKLPTCELITCSSPPQISNGKHDGEGVERFAYNSTVTYRCDSGFHLVGNASIRCTSRDKTNGVWSGAAPECKDSRGNAIQVSKKASTWEMKLNLYKKSLQNTISFSHSSSFSRTPGQSWRPIWSSGEFINGTPWLLPVPYTWSFHFFTCFSSVSRGCATSAFRFVVPLYKTQNYYSPGIGQGSSKACPPKYMGISGILPQAGCFENLKWSKVASFCGTRSWAARRSRTWQKCCYNRFPMRCKGLFYP